MLMVPEKGKVNWVLSLLLLLNLNSLRARIILFLPAVY